jgi:hypothetical protein
MVVHRGKGYGEGEIVEYMFQHSKLIRLDDVIIKLTGRMQLDNIDILTRKMDTQKLYINATLVEGKRIADTRIYAMPSKVFKEYFINAYTRVSDRDNYFLEHVYADVIRENDLTSLNLPLYPRIRGVAGTSGHVYSYKTWKCVIKDLLCKFQYYALKRYGKL